jgi:hypothetical protein
MRPAVKQVVKAGAAAQAKLTKAVATAAAGRDGAPAVRQGKLGKA